jgi:hypothetical protein
MQWIADHWFELATTGLLAAVTCDRKWNNSTILEQLNDILRGYSLLASRNAASERDKMSAVVGRPQ